MKKRRNQSTKSEKGLTLITLIVMIIILVILSAIVIRAITGEEGLIKTTKEVALTQEIQEYKERITEEVRGAVVKYAAIGEEIGLEEIAEEIKEMDFKTKMCARTTVYYAHPYCSGERGSNENGNRLIRRFIPKGIDITTITEEFVQNIEDWINNYPRAMFKYKSTN